MTRKTHYRFGIDFAKGNGWTLTLHLGRASWTWGMA
jgi:hypothetical protein